MKNPLTFLSRNGTTPGTRARFGLSRNGFLGLFAVVAIAAVACGTDDADSSASAGSVASGSSGGSQQAVSSGGSGGSVSIDAIKDNLPIDFEINVYQREDLLGGDKVMLSDILAQGKPVVLNAWAGLCPPCRAEMPELQAVFQEFGTHMTLVGLDIGPFVGLGNEQDGRDLLAEIGVTYPAGNTETGAVVSKFKLLGMPSTYFIKPDGGLLRSWTGAIDSKELSKIVGELIAAS